MNNSWDSYYVVFLSAFISFLFFHKKQEKIPASQLEAIKLDRTILGQRINIRFFLATNAALLLITLALELIPCVTTLQSDNREGLGKGLISIVTIAGFAVLGLLYSVRKGDMGWLSSFQTQSAEDKRHGL